MSGAVEKGRQWSESTQSEAWPRIVLSEIKATTSSVGLRTTLILPNLLKITGMQVFYFLFLSDRATAIKGGVSARAGVSREKVADEGKLSKLQAESGWG